MLKPLFGLTLRHRLARFEETTGASLRNCEALTEVWWALTREDATRLA